MVATTKVHVKSVEDEFVKMTKNFVGEVKGQADIHFQP